MKRFLAIAFAFLMAIGFVGCAEYRYADGTNGGTSGGNSDGTITTKPDDTSSDNSGDNSGDDSASGGNTTVTPEPTEEGVFSVTLYYNNEIFVPTTKIYAYWNDGQSINKAQFNSGVAKITGLDGDYQVTLSAIPTGYTYDPNIYYATNDSKDIGITLYKLVSMSGAGTSFDNSECITITRTGAYRVTISSPDQLVYFKYQPTSDGYYSISSMLDITANEINPVLIYYSSANSQFVNEFSKQVIDGGGVSNTYTKNFNLEVYEATGTEAFIAFCITAESMTDAAFPIDIDFMLTRTGDYGGSDYWDTVVYPTFDFTTIYNDELGEYTELGKTLLNPTGTFKYAANIDSSLPNTLQSKYFKLNPDDGFYHVYDETKYADNNGYGPILYAKLTQDCELYNSGGDEYFPTAKYNQLFLNFKKFGGLYNLNGKNYANFFFETTNGLPRTDKKINSSGDETSIDIYFTAGYAAPASVNEYGQPDIANPTYKYLTKDGTFPVTEEIKEFLQDFAISQLLFRDGFGEAENGRTNTSTGLKYSSDEDSQWLFACGYYG